MHVVAGEVGYLGGLIVVDLRQVAGINVCADADGGRCDILIDWLRSGTYVPSLPAWCRCVLAV